jgi:hypothetical protein
MLNSCTSSIPRPEYPRPQFVREQWINLNGIWEFEFDHGNSGKERKLYEAKDEIQSEVKDEIKNEINSEIQDEIIDEIVNEIEKTDNTKQDNDTIKINKEKIVKAEKEISTSDKLKALDIILKKLKSSDIEKLIGMLKKGKLSKEDINNAKRIIKEKVTEEEKNVLKDLFNKYEYLIE